MGYTEVFTRSQTASGALVGKRFVGVSGAQAGAGEQPQGVALFDTDDGREASVIALGTAIVEAGAAVAAGAFVESDANGKAIAHKNGYPAGLALEAAAQDGDEIEVLVMPPRDEPLISLAAGAGGLAAQCFAQADGTLPGAGETAVGVAVAAAAQGVAALVRVAGIAYVLSGAAVTAGQGVEADAAGKAVPLNAGVELGTALDTAAGADEVIRVRIPA